MRTKRKTTVTVETERVLVIRRRSRPASVWCEACGGAVRMAPAAEAALLAGASLRDICRWVESGRLHFAETADGLLFICLNSLPK